jgi:hypothetical protein
MKQPSAKDKEIKGLLRALEWYQARYKPIEKLEESIRELKIELTDVYNDGLVLKKQHQEELKDQKAKIREWLKQYDQKGFDNLPLLKEFEELK